MSMKWLTTQVVEIHGWPNVILNTEYLDFAINPYEQPKIATRAEMQQKLEEDYETSAKALNNLKLEDLGGIWDIRQGDTVFMKWTKYGALRHSFNQISHHRAQLGVYYRLNNIPVPASYGSSANEHLIILDYH